MPRLRQLYAYLTAGCNLACRHCWLAPRLDSDGRCQPVLSPELLEAAVREAAPLGLEAIKLTGGEPLLHPEFMRILEIVQRAKLGLTVETNGLLCTPATAIEIARFPRPFVSVSIDGADAATHEQIRGVSGCFAAAVGAVRNLVSAGIRPQIIMSLMRCNADQVAAVVRLAESLGAASVKFNPVQPTARGEALHRANASLGVPELLALGRSIETELASSSRVRLVFDYPVAFRPLSRLATHDGCSTCGILGIIGVIPTGHYALCGIGEHVPDLVFGAVGQDTLEDVWAYNPTLRELRDGLPGRLQGVCVGCLVKQRCFGSCLAQNYYRTGSLWAPFWFCEQADTAGLFPASRRIPAKTAAAGPGGSR